MNEERAENKNIYISITKLLKKNYFEIILISLSIIITVIVFALHLQSNKNLTSLTQADKEIEIKQETDKNSTSSQKKFIFVDISGAVMNPNIYRVTSHSRLKDVLVMAGGLSADANRDFFYRNFNLASYVYDQEKIYVPHNYEIWRGIFTEPHRIVDFTKPVKLTNEPYIDTENVETDKININTAAFSELDTLPGIGPVTAQKIITNRPYSSIEDLLTKKILSKSVFDKIKEKIER